ncbi:2,3-diaminopropionate biosynthesis protein SbnA [Paenibacillus antarcticus]|uniref:2,3-diaminopropionate biosynthesis protein SbnA n=1 Tax=Paenibacillus antarcticus TaxID=253703 RepID=A0A168M009_9BACL|nr:2,3-diaminopropionate biosynthesis protein SbnA [Paenibacillus antarcticus]OAB44062.1 2,3-diaminopropionate biosynthesis protein SbnA [Paenibacillus antarcticus]
MNIDEGIFRSIGRTPLVPLHRLFKQSSFDVFGKLEMMNPGGSSKDRSALNMIREAIKRGDLNDNSVVIESSSGNLGISLAHICRYLGLRFICVVDPRTTEQHKAIIRSFHGEIELVTHKDIATGEFLPARIRRVKELLQNIPNSYWTNQYGNPDNYRAHELTTMPEIMDTLGTVDYLFCGVSSCGTIRGCMEYTRKNNLSTTIVAVDAEGSIIFGGKKGSRHFPGLGAGVVPALYHPDIADRIIHISDTACVKGCHDLVHYESIMAGASSGGVIAAIQRMAASIPEGSTCVAILPDRGERYLDTIYNPTWIEHELNKSQLDSLEAQI